MSFFSIVGLCVVQLLCAADLRAQDVVAKEAVAPKGPTQISTDIQPEIPTIVPRQGSAVPTEVYDNSEDLPARTVYFELNPVEGVSRYNIQVKTLTQHWAEPYTAELDGTTLRLRMTPGRYTLRTRSLPENDEAGYWSRWQDFWIHFKPPKNFFPADNSTIVPKGGKPERVVFEWPAVAGAREYLFTLYDSSGEMIKSVRTKGTFTGVTLKLNSSYAWSLVPRSSASEPLPPLESIPLRKFRIGDASPELHKARISVDPQPLATSYDFEFVRMTSDATADEPAIYHSESPEFLVPLAPGEYEMRVRTNYEQGYHSNWTAPRKFWVAIKPPKHIGPTGSAQLEPNDDLASDVILRWEQPLTPAKTFRVLIWNQKGELVKDELTEQTFLNTGLPHDQEYSWTVTALQGHEKRRKPASLNETAADPDAQVSKFKVGHYKRLDLSSAEEPSQLYALGRYFTSVMQYQGLNYDNNTRTEQNVFGGTGELGFGYWDRKSDFGGLLAVSEAGFTITNKTYAYTSGSVLLGYRVRNDSARTRWRFWVGPAYKETPEIMMDPDNRSIYFGRIKALGAEGRISFLGEFNEKYGYHLFGHYVRGLKAVSTVNGLPMQSMTLMNLGVFATYRYSQNIVGMVGYSYQIDQAKYATTETQISGINSIEFRGHFLSLTLEVGLEKTQR